MLSISTHGNARLEVVPGTIEDDEVEDPATVSIEVAVTVLVNGGSPTETHLRLQLDDLPFGSLPAGPLPLEPTSEDSTIYLLDRHREVSTTQLVIDSVGAGRNIVDLEAELHLETGVERFQLTFTADER